MKTLKFVCMALLTMFLCVNLAACSDEEVVEKDEPIQQEGINVGDFFYSDGTCSAQLDPNKTVIGIVFSTDPTRIGDAEKEALKAKGIDTPHGLVIGVKYAAKDVRWGKNSYTPELNELDTFEELDADISGLYNCNMIKARYKDFSDYPAFRAVTDYAIAAPENTTGWFLPSVGQLYDFLANIGGLPDWDESLQSSRGVWSTPNLPSDLNASFARCGEGNYDGFLTLHSYQYLWTSTLAPNNYSFGRAWSFRLLKYDNGSDPTVDLCVAEVNNNQYQREYYVYPVLAF